MMREVPGGGENFLSQFFRNVDRMWMEFCWQKMQKFFLRENNVLVQNFSQSLSRTQRRMQANESTKK